eukprot:TRINITY_DN86249_c0_g1_i1.p1 TRINITY_DN86249_c0_g1~~TRINITY_DN86249_c0_g1_i1.p1  ORF type:complete len:132 (+),score=22.36 TRINITY_DN86249_c0_g1_i1:44-397(+)
MVATWTDMKKSGAVTPSTGNGARVGINKGFKTTKRVRPVAAGKRLALQKNKLNAVKEVVQEAVGLCPYEKRLVELLKVGREKRALRFAKRRLGSFLRGKKKRELVSNMMRKQIKKKN